MQVEIGNAPSRAAGTKKHDHRSTCRVVAAATFLVASAIQFPAVADEGGVSFWLPGQYGSFAAIAPSVGWTLPMQAYAYSGQAGRNSPTERGRDLAFGLDTDFTALFVAPTYAPDATIFGARPAFSLAFFPGWNEVSADVTAGSARRQRSDSVAGFGDLYPTAQLFWDGGLHNWMAYLTGNIPVGSYDPNRLANLGLGHAAVDAGGAYTYLNSSTGWEFSVTAGLTYNFENPDTNYTSGIDFHADFGLSRSLTEQFFVGLVGYAYVQLTPDKGQPPVLGSFESQTFAIGPQIGYTFQVGDRAIYTNLRGYVEFAAKDRPQGGSIFLTTSIPLSAPAGRK